MVVVNHTKFDQYLQHILSKLDGKFLLVDNYPCVHAWGLWEQLVRTSKHVHIVEMLTCSRRCIFVGKRTLTFLIFCWIHPWSQLLAEAHNTNDLIFMNLFILQNYISLVSEKSTLPKQSRHCAIWQCDYFRSICVRMFTRRVPVFWSKVTLFLRRRHCH